ncbi:MAG: stage sporulation protein [Moorella sp. (in: firmicutes)]|uniref:M50 family metallopeptidase n=1 Tax=unclassified Neomoorella TaxID=2676739 RepID=UPI0010FFB0CF|nr:MULTISPECIES: M50 family metallopeptidase [unclassified Moorella (in: firmicutes)]MDK2815749.1 stage sporulation protein [Moorella sp. (in: firmicutes)]MDK2894311.1 stage sporulation protein [Moorella sp. (in: firmicutes)]GEA16420.1 peptidase M50 [Moorella sp. E308F]GEA17402.1 peptidase M50 [Moorella sp. E306M]
MRAGRVGTAEIIFNDYFLLLLGLYFLVGVLPQALLLFTAVAWHEGCHVLAASRLGWKVKSVELFPFGGVARLRRPQGRDFTDEALIALAGPAASFFLALGITLFDLLLNLTPAWLLFFRQVNLILALFNLWPGLPLDGGRIYRALRAKHTGLYRATLEGVYGGQVLALLLGLGSIGGFIFRLADLQGLALALFIYYAARREGEVAPYMFWQDFWRQRGKEAVKGDQFKTTRVFWLAAGPGLTLARVARSFSPRSFNLVAVIGKGGRLEGILTETEIMQELLEGGNNTLDVLLRR